MLSKVVCSATIVQKSGMTPSVCFLFKGRDTWHGGEALVLAAKAAIMLPCWPKLAFLVISFECASIQGPIQKLSLAIHSFSFVRSMHNFMPSINAVGLLNSASCLRDEKFFCPRPRPNCWTYSLMKFALFLSIYMYPYAKFLHQTLIFLTTKVAPKHRKPLPSLCSAKFL